MLHIPPDPDFDCHKTYIGEQDGIRVYFGRNRGARSWNLVWRFRDGWTSTSFNNVERLTADMIAETVRQLTPLQKEATQ
jgi:hypothetical protein